MAKKKTDETLGIDFRQFGGIPVIQGAETAWYFGWVAPLAPEGARQTLPLIEYRQQHPVLWSDVFLSDGSDPDDDVFLWEAEHNVKGKEMPSWNQRDVGSCVSFGWGRAANDLIYTAVEQGKIEPPEADIATEPIYGGSRVEVGKGVLGGSDGSLGSWAADWSLRWGMLQRKVYGSHDLREYNTRLCREWGRRGVPDELEPEAKLYPIKSVALVTTWDQAWQALGLRRPIPVCSNRGFDSPLRDGFCEPRGTWNHCMEIVGRFTAAGSRGRCGVIRNSWDDYLKSLNNPHAYITTKSGRKVKLPPGCFATTGSVLNGMLAQRDSYAIDDQGGFKPRNRHRW